MEFSVISCTGLQLPASSLDQPAACRDEEAKSVGLIGHMSSQAEAECSSGQDTGQGGA